MKYYIVGASLDLSGWDTAKVTNMSSMFNGLSNLTTIYVGDGWGTTNVTSSGSMFKGDTKLVGSAGTTYDANHLDKTYARVDNPPDYPGYFTYKGSNPDNPGNNVTNTTNNVFNNIFNNNNSTQNPTDNYSNPQGVSSTKNIIPGTSGPNWFLFILLLTLSVLTLGISLVIFWRKRRQKQQENL